MIAQSPEKCASELEISECWDMIGRSRTDPTPINKTQELQIR